MKKVIIIIIVLLFAALAMADEEAQDKANIALLEKWYDIKSEVFGLVLKKYGGDSRIAIILEVNGMGDMSRRVAPDKDAVYDYAGTELLKYPFAIETLSQREVMMTVHGVAMMFSTYESGYKEATKSAYNLMSDRQKENLRMILPQRANEILKKRK